MQSENFSFLKAFRVLDKINIALLFAVCLVGASLLIFLKHESVSPIMPAPATSEESRSPPIYDAIGTGPLALASKDQDFPLPGLRDEILFLGRNERPDARNRSSCLIGLKSSSIRFAMGENEPIFLDYENGKVCLSQSKTPLMISGQVVDGCLELSASINIKDLSRQVFWKIPQTPLKNLSLDPQFVTAVKKLQQMKLWGPDQLLVHYGGPTFDHAKRKLRFELDDVLVPASIGDVFVWDEQRWSAPKAPTDNQVLAEVIDMSPSQIEWRVWAIGGLDQARLKVAVQQPLQIALNMNEVFSRLRMRTHESVSCQIGQSSRLLRKGDWLEQCDGHWRHLRRLDEIDACIAGNHNKPLFVCDGLEKVDDKWMLKGHVFDAKRTQAFPICLPMHAPSKQVPQRPQIHDFDDDDLFDDDDDFLNSLLPGGEYDD